MSYKIEFDKRSLTELDDILRWYEDKSLSTAAKFQTAFSLTIEVLAKGVVDYIAFREEIKKAPITDFPHIVYYSRQEETKTVFVHAILHAKRKDGFVAGRLKT